MARKGLPADRETAHIGTVLGVTDTKLEEAGATQLGDDRPAGRIFVRRLRVVDRLAAPVFKVCRQLAVTLLEERPGEEARVGHQSPWNSGVRFAVKASYAR